jgi:hypothetical protein
MKARSLNRKLLVLIGIVSVALVYVGVAFFRDFKSQELGVTTNVWKHRYEANKEERSNEFPGAGFFTKFTQAYEKIREMQDLIKVAAGSAEGVIGNIALHPTQLYYYARAASSSKVNTICEVGFGPGHSTLLYLMMNPKAHVYSWDLFPEGEAFGLPVGPVQKAALKYIYKLGLGDRLKLIAGESNITIGGFIQENPGFKCDLISIDGSHTPPQPFYDMYNMIPLAKKETVVLLDDMDSLMGELDRAVNENFMWKYECMKGEFNVDKHFESYVHTVDKTFCATYYLVD